MSRRLGSLSVYDNNRPGLNSGWGMGNRSSKRYNQTRILRQDEIRLEEMKAEGADPWDIWYLQESIKKRR